MSIAHRQEEDLHTPASHFEILSEQFKNARIDRLEEVLTEKINSTNDRINSTKNELTEKINSIRTELITEIKNTNERINSTKNELSGQIKALFWIQGATIALLIAIVAKLFSN
jgi:peptidoglycan hydrolase CwlO-like protein